MDSSSLTALQKAAQYYSQDNLVQADSICRALHLKIPNEIDVTHLLALICKKRGANAEAEQLFNKCIHQGPQRADILTNLGNLYRSLARFEDAEQHYRLALTTDSSFRQARLALARLLISVQRHPQGEKESLILIQQNKRDAEAWVALAACYRGQKEYPRAEQAFAEALKIRPDYGTARQNLGALLTQLNRHDEALKQLELAIKCGVTAPEVNINRAAALAGLGRFDDAIEVLVQSVAQQGDAIESLELLAKIRFMRGEENFARELTQSIEKYPRNINLLLCYSRLLQGADLLQDAEEILLTNLEENRGHPDIFCALAAVQQLAGKHSDSLRNAKQAIVNGASRIQSQELTIDALMSLGQVDEALPLIHDARRNFPLNQWYIAMEATAARLKGDALYETLYDYDKYVQSFELEPPTGWSSIAQFNTDLLAVLNQRHQLHVRPLDQSLRNGTQTPSSLLSDSADVIKAFLTCLEQPIQRYRDSLGTDAAHPLQARNHGRSELIGCWSVRLKRGGFHFNHVHPEGWLSSAYYVETPPEIETDDAKSGWIKFGEPRFSIPGATAEKFVKPMPGKLVLFPSYMWHGTVPIKGEAPRVAIAFDVETKLPAGS
ncbi:MAG: hypothetical protein ACI8XU_002005 [Kiritimatiellia bacterium]|jgi:uncharacterized protein (TIGR02466 family)